MAHLTGRSPGLPMGCAQRRLVTVGSLTRLTLLALLLFSTLDCVVPVWGQSPDGSPAGSPIIAPGAELALVADGFRFTEGPAADAEGNVFFTDQPNDQILKWSAESGEVTQWLQPAGRSNGMFFTSKGDLIVCADEANQLWRIRPDKSHEVLLDGFQGKLFNGPNDVWVSSTGAIYFTDPFYRRDYWDRSDEPQLPRQVYRLDADLQQVSVVADDFKQPNGIVGDPEKGLLYVADIGDSKTYRFRIDDDGQLTDRKLFCKMGSDGMTLDREGNLYLTGKGVTVFNSDGQQVEHIDVPENWTANICFGGNERKTLLITASDSFYRLDMRVQGW